MQEVMVGEANPEEIARIKELTGCKPRLGATSDGQQCLRIGDIELVARRLNFLSITLVLEIGRTRTLLFLSI